MNRKLVNVLFAAAALAILISQYKPGPKRSAGDPASNTQAFTIDKSPATQANRKKLIENLQKGGILDKIDSNAAHIEMWVKPSFYALHFDDKTTTAKLVFAYAWDEQMLALDVIDARSGKIIGRYRPASGLTMD